jgi:hypothetical protein
VGSSLVQTPGGRLLRRSSHEGDRPALSSAQFALSHACWLVMYLVAGVVGNAIGLFWIFGLLDLLVVAASALAAWLWPASDPEVLDTNTHSCTITFMTSITGMSMRVGRGRSRTGTLTRMRPSAIATATLSTRITSTGRHEVVVRLTGALLNAPSHPIRQTTTPAPYWWRLATPAFLLFGRCQGERVGIAHVVPGGLDPAVGR